MAGDTGSHIRGVLDGDLADVTTPNRSRQAQDEIDAQIAQHQTQAAAATQAPALMQWAVQPGQIATAGAPGAGGGYQFNPATIAASISQWKQVLAEIESDSYELQRAMQKVNPPSEDTPARENADAIRKSIRAAIDQNKSMQEYAKAWLTALQKANGTYVEIDETTSKSLSGDSSATDGHGLNS